MRATRLVAMFTVVTTIISADHQMSTGTADALSTSRATGDDSVRSLRADTTSENTTEERALTSIPKAWEENLWAFVRQSKPVENFLATLKDLTSKRELLVRKAYKEYTIWVRAEAMKKEQFRTHPRVKLAKILEAETKEDPTLIKNVLIELEKKRENEAKKKADEYFKENFTKKNIKSMVTKEFEDVAPFVIDNHLDKLFSKRLASAAEKAKNFVPGNHNARSVADRLMRPLDRKYAYGERKVIMNFVPAPGEYSQGAASLPKRQSPANAEPTSLDKSGEYSQGAASRPKRLKAANAEPTTSGKFDDDIMNEQFVMWYLAKKDPDEVKKILTQEFSEEVVAFVHKRYTEMYKEPSDHLANYVKKLFPTDTLHTIGKRMGIENAEKGSPEHMLYEAYLKSIDDHNDHTKPSHAPKT